MFNRNQSLTAVLLGATLLFVPPYASAHARPKVMVPAADSTVPSPSTISVTFSEAIEPRFSSLNVTDEQEKKKFNTVSSAPLANDPKTLTLALPPLQPGGYLVHWVSVAADGHRMEGEYKFTVR
jgi:methionine-rich copper-binding protein CopC